MAEITKTADETTGGRTVEELFEQEEIYGPYWQRCSRRNYWWYYKP